jgi:hypothetical protein
MILNSLSKIDPHAILGMRQLNGVYPQLFRFPHVYGFTKIG